MGEAIEKHEEEKEYEEESLDSGAVASAIKSGALWRTLASGLHVDLRHSPIRCIVTPSGRAPAKSCVHHLVGLHLPICVYTHDDDALMSEKRGRSALPEKNAARHATIGESRCHVERALLQDAPRAHANRLTAKSKARSFRAPPPRCRLDWRRVLPSGSGVFGSMYGFVGLGFFALHSLRSRHQRSPLRHSRAYCGP